MSLQKEERTKLEERAKNGDIKSQLSMNSEYQAMQYQNDIIKYKMQVRELESKEKDFR